MASIERTAYPRFRRLVTAAELAGLSPTEDEATWARSGLVLTSTCWLCQCRWPSTPGAVPSRKVRVVRRVSPAAIR